MIAGLLLFVGATRTDDYFSWTIDPPQTAAFLGAAYWAAAVLFSWASAQHSWQRLRIAVYPELAVAVVLLIGTYMHLDKFHDDLFGYFWVSVYAIAAPVLIYLIVDHEDGRRGQAPGRDACRCRRPCASPWPAQALVFAVYGVGLFVSPGGFDGAWPWALTPLTARAIAAFLLGFALAAAIAIRTDSLQWFRGAALTYAVLGLLELLAAALHSSDFKDGAALPLFARLLRQRARGRGGRLAARPRSSGLQLRAGPSRGHRRRRPRRRGPRERSRGARSGPSPRPRSRARPRSSGC